jgi:hypothetical protein
LFFIPVSWFSKVKIVWKYHITKEHFVKIAYYLFTWIYITPTPTILGSSWPWSYGSWIYNYLCTQCLSPLMLLVRISTRARCTTLYDKVCQWLATGQWFSPGPPVSSTNKTDHHDITEILLKVALNTIKQKNKTKKEIYYTNSYNLIK